MFSKCLKGNEEVNEQPAVTKVLLRNTKQLKNSDKRVQLSVLLLKPYAVLLVPNFTWIN